MNGRRMVWTAVIGAVAAMITGLVRRRRQSPMQRIFKGGRSLPRIQWMQLARPMMRMARRVAR